MDFPLLIGVNMLFAVLTTLLWTKFGAHKKATVREKGGSRRGGLSIDRSIQRLRSTNHGGNSMHLRKLGTWSFLMGLAIAWGPAARGQYTITTIAGGATLDGSVATAVSIQGNSTA